MTQVSIGQVANLEDLLRGLESVREGLETACREQVAAAERQYAKASEETQNSEEMLDRATQAEQSACRSLSDAEQKLESAKETLSTAESALSTCEAQPRDEDGWGPDCSGEAAAASSAQTAVDSAEAVVNDAKAAADQAAEDRQHMQQRVECAKNALSIAEQAFERAQQECTARMQEVGALIDAGAGRLTAAQRALDAYLAANPPSARFYRWLNWHPEPGRTITPDVIRDRLNLSREEQRLLQEYLYDRYPGYRSMVDKYRGEWVAARGDVERNVIARKARIHLAGSHAEHLARHSLAPLGGGIVTQRRTRVDDDGRYTTTDLVVADLRVPVVLGRGESMGAAIGGSLAIEVKCGKADYLYSQMSHMSFQAKGHKQADARCTLCSRDIHHLPPEKAKELRDALHAAGSPLVGMLPVKNDIDQVCIAFIQSDTKGSRS